jgi:dihydroorotase-like cyclic amidohydrolase
MGSDADLTIVDMEKKLKFTKDMVHSKSGWTLFDRDTFTGWSVQPLVKGKTVMKDGEITRGGPDRVTAHRGKGPN